MPLEAFDFHQDILLERIRSGSKGSFLTFHVCSSPERLAAPISLYPYTDTCLQTAEQSSISAHSPPESRHNRSSAAQLLTARQAAPACPGKEIQQGLNYRVATSDLSVLTVHQQALQTPGRCPADGISSSECRCPSQLLLLPQTTCPMLSVSHQGTAPRCWHRERRHACARRHGSTSASWDQNPPLRCIRYRIRGSCCPKRYHIKAAGVL